MNVPNLASGKAEHIATDRDSLSPVLARFARSLWPWSERRLAVLVCCLAALDYMSTVAFLNLSGSKGAYEAGILASRALERGGLGGLLFNDVAAVGLLLVAAGGVRNICLKKGELSGFSHAAFVLMLLPYAAAAAAAIANNLVIACI
ncbi:MAG: hypothetical protein Q7R50_05645 [Dehalococcoidales bacterium]|nr:hypothetical protein [Dehalococcoidales bacterium]